MQCGCSHLNSSSNIKLYQIVNYNFNYLYTTLCPIIKIKVTGRVEFLSADISQQSVPVRHQGFVSNFAKFFIVWNTFCIGIRYKFNYVMIEARSLYGNCLELNKNLFARFFPWPHCNVFISIRPGNAYRDNLQLRKDCKEPIS